MAVYRLDLRHALSQEFFRIFKVRFWQANLTLLELAKSKRALCQNTECKKNGVKIAAGELRWCTLVTIKENQSWQYKHWGCVTPKQIANLKETIEDDLGLLDGYEELDGESQDKVRKALADGHVDDSDWKGDIEQNRPGKHGFRTPKKKVKSQMADSANEDENEDDAPSPTKPAQKKRGRTKSEKDEDNTNANEPLLKKVKKASVKVNSTKDDDAIDESVQKSPPTKKDRAKGQKTKAQAKTEQPNVRDQNSDHEVVSQLSQQKTRHHQKLAASKTTRAKDDDVDVTNGDVSSSRRGRKKAGSLSVIENEDEDRDLESKQETHKSKRAPKKAKAKARETEAVTTDDDEDPEPSLKAKKGAKKAAPRANIRAKRPSAA